MADTSVLSTSTTAAADPGAAVLDIECAPCSAEGLHKEVTGFCSDCGDHLCEDCVRYHRRFSALKNHQLVEKSAVTSPPKKLRVADVCTEKCPDHQSEVIRLYCPDHNSLACSVCVTMNHSACGRVELIEDLAAKLQARPDYKEFTTKLSDFFRMSEATAKLTVEVKKRSLDCKNNVTKDLQSLKDYLVDNLDKHIAAITADTEKIYLEDVEAMDDISTEHNKCLAEVQSLEAKLRTLHDKKHFCQIFLIMKQKEKYVDELQVQEKVEVMKDIEVSEFAFLPDLKFKKLIKKEESVGKLVTTLTKFQRLADSTKQHTPAKNENAQSVEMENLENAKLVHLTDIKTSNSKELNDCVIGIVVVSDDKVVIADRSLKLIDTVNKKVLSSLFAAEFLGGITVCEDTIAVTLPMNQTIMFVKYANGLVYDREISVTGDCRGVDYYDNKLYVVYHKEKKLELMTTTGVVLHRLDLNQQGQPIFESPIGVTVNPATKRVYVCDDKFVKNINLEETTLTESKEWGDHYWTFPKQVAVDKRGVMYLCTGSPQMIQLLTPDGQTVKTLIKEPEDFTATFRSICYCEKTGRLFVGLEFGMGCDDDDGQDMGALRVYQLS